MDFISFWVGFFAGQLLACRANVEQLIASGESRQRDKYGNEITWADYHAKPTVAADFAPDWIRERNKILNESIPMCRIHPPGA